LKKITILIIFVLTILQLYSFQSGEKLVFKIKYGIISAGEATLAIEDFTHHDSVDCWLFSITTKTNSFFDRIFKVRDRIESVTDKAKFISYRFEKKLQEGNYKQHRIHLYYPDQYFSFYLKYSRKSKEFKEKRMEIPDETQDILSAFYFVRKQNLSVGDSLLINVTSDGRNVVTKVLVHKRETLDTIFGETECLVIEPVMETEAVFKQSGRIQIWVTDDDRKIPVKLESKVTFGSFKAYLEEFEGN
jgi:hypothetical protein